MEPRTCWYETGGGGSIFVQHRPLGLRFRSSIPRASRADAGCPLIWLSSWLSDQYRRRKGLTLRSGSVPWRPRRGTPACCTDARARVTEFLRSPHQEPQPSRRSSPSVFGPAPRSSAAASSTFVLETTLINERAYARPHTSNAERSDPFRALSAFTIELDPIPRSAVVHHSSLSTSLRLARVIGDSWPNRNATAAHLVCFRWLMAPVVTPAT